MILTAICFAAFLPKERVDWQPLLDKVAPYSLLGDANYDHFRRRLVQAQIEGSSEWRFCNGLARSGADGAIGLFLNDEEGCLALFTRHGSKTMAEVLEVGDEWLLQPHHFARKGDMLAVSGLVGYNSNYPSVCVRTYRRTSEGWSHTSELTSNKQAVAVPKISIGTNGQIAPIVVQTRGYPQYMNAAHVSANLSIEEGWSFVDGVPKRDWTRLGNTPFNALDRMVGALLQGDSAQVRKLCKNPAVAGQVMKLRPRLTKGSRTVFYNGVSSVDGTVIGIEDVGYFHFARRTGGWVVERFVRTQR